MAHFAKVEDGMVTQVLVVPDEHESDGEAYLNSLGLDGSWVQTSYNSNIRGKFASIGDTYDSVADVFIAPIIESTAPAIESMAEETPAAG